MSRPVLCLVVFGIKVTGSRGEGGVSNKGALYDSLSHIFNDFSLCHPCQLTCDLLHCDYDSDLISHIMANCLIVGSKLTTIFVISQARKQYVVEAWLCSVINSLTCKRKTTGPLYNQPACIGLYQRCNRQLIDFDKDTGGRALESIILLLVCFSRQEL